MLDKKFPGILAGKIFIKEKKDEAATKGADFVLNKELSRKQLCSLISFQAFQTGTSKLGTNGP